MYSFEPTDEQKMLIDAVNRYALNDLRRKAHEADEGYGFPQEIIDKGWQLGVLQGSIPETYGGFGEHSALTGVLAAEEMSYGDLAGTLAVLTPALFALPILACGSEEQKKTYLPPIAEGGWQPYTAACIEPFFDFDLLEMRTIAEKKNGHYVLRGEKIYVPFANEARQFLVYANLEGRTQGFIVDPNTPGLIVGERQKTLGVNALPIYKVSLEDVIVPAERRLGGVNGCDLNPVFDLMRLAMAAMAVGVSRAAFEYSRDYAKEREVFGVKVAQKQAIAFMLAEMATEIEAIRLLTWEAAWMVDKKREEASKQAYLAHIGAVDMAMMVTDRAVQILGGHGYIREHPVELWMRNGRGFAMLTGLGII
ncbi:MAG: acyl-CoA dehydrogenase family protein [Anaerolineales bacterium]|nr:acyl-CoA dehydrogenase family protein [Anaerolineales bacterium]MCS7247543.1 acyl-CoA dehydrogenase family protein [Anaerolineales bacterium]MDW8161354.1 acyl-CoA dehydrogenase family protein [Anaerolineales bacterium]MDW8447089.1 acyl-CoA dehydrogenase family protein [Anaerolineales bacterium]